MSRFLLGSQRSNPTGSAVNAPTSPRENPNTTSGTSNPIPITNDKPQGNYNMIYIRKLLQGFMLFLN